MIRSWIAFLALFASIPAWLSAEELPAPKVSAADVPAPPVPQLPALQMPLPDIGAPAEQHKLPDPEPATKPPKVVTPGSLLPNPAPIPGPRIFPEAKPNPRGTTPSLPAESSPAPQTVLEQEGRNNNVPDELKWRYKWHNGQWWYWSPAEGDTAERWMIWDKNSWTIYDPATYQAPAGFAAPGPRVVTQQSLSVPLPESNPTTEVSVPESYYLTPPSAYVSPTPYAFGVDSYYGPYGPAASYYNRHSGVSLSMGSSAYVPVYPGYLAPQYFSPRSAAPVNVYRSYGVPGYYGGRGVSIGFGF